MSRPLEYTVAIDSRNRNVEEYPEANDFTLDINFSRGLPVTRIYLGSLELPLPQLTVEEAWSRLYFDEGTSFIINEAADLCLRTLTIQEFDGTFVNSIIPIWLNPILQVDVSDPSSPIFTTLYEHALDLRGLWTWGTPIRLISTDLTDPTFIDLTAENSNLTVLTTNSFQISNLPAPFVPSGNPFGYVHAPAIGNPQFLANILTAGFDQVVPNRYQVTYDTRCGRFCLNMRSLTCNILLAPNQRCEELPPPAMLIIEGDNCLASVLGFGCTNVPFPPAERAICPGICAKFVYRCLSCIRITPAFYVQAPNFAAEIQLQTNRFVFEFPCPGAPPDTVAPPPMFVFSNECGTCFPLVLPYGKYSPDTFATTLENAMNGAVGANVYTVNFEISSNSARENSIVGLLKGCFIFESTDGSCFGLEFEDARNNLATRLGFTGLCYRGGSQFKGEMLYIPVKGCDCTSAPLRYIENVYTPFIRTNQKRLGIQSCKCKPLGETTALATPILGGEVLRITTNQAATPIAHGYQPEDVISIIVGGQTFQVRVIAVIDAFSFEVEVAGVAVLMGLAPDTPVCTSLFGPIILNLYFSEDCMFQSMRAELTGFPAAAVLWEGPQSLPVVSPNQFNLDSTDYILIEISKPNQSTYIQHQWKDDTNVRLFGKIVIYPGFRLERIYPIESVFQGMKVINQLSFRILNPDHSLYNFHGRNFSMTLVLVVAAQVSSQLCY